MACMKWCSAVVILTDIYQDKTEHEEHVTAPDGIAACAESG